MNSKLLKLCCTCKIKKSLLLFNKNNKSKDKKYAQCAKCQNKTNKIRYMQKRELILQKAKDYRVKNDWKIRLHEWKRRGVIFKDSNEFESLYSLANTPDLECAICKSKKQVRRHSLDHNHQTHKPRGFLCDNCNSKVVKVVETWPHLIAKAQAYLEKYK